MNIVCTICSDLVNPAENIHVTKCGHVFHHHCLAQWMERSKTCPQCRNKVTEKCMFRLYPTVSNENNNEDAAMLQSRLDNVLLELRQERAKSKEADEKLADLTTELEKQQEVIAKYEKQLVSYDSKVKAIREQLSYANLQGLVATKLRDENDALKKNMQTLNGLQKVLNGTTEEVEEMLKGYSDLRTIATFATALKRALCVSESKKKEWRDRLFLEKKQLVLEKKAEMELQAKIKYLELELKESAAEIESLKKEQNATEVKNHTGEPQEPREPREKNHTPQRKMTKVVVRETPRLNDAILETNSNNSSFNTMVEQIEKSDSPYLDLKHGHIVTALQQEAGQKARRARLACKPAARLYISTLMSAPEKRVEPQVTTSIFHRKEPMKIASFDAESPLDISYDGMGGHSKVETFPVPKKSPLKSCIPKVSAKHKLKRPNTAGNYNIETMLKKIREK